MDLSRAKTILIISFLVLNLYLVFTLRQNPVALYQSGNLTTEEAELTRELLVQAGYELAVAIPRQTAQLSLLLVSRPSEDGAAWAQKQWDMVPRGNWSAEDGVLRYVSGDETLDISPLGQVVLQKGQFSFTAEDRRRQVEHFLRERGFWRSDLKYDVMTLEKDGSVTYRFLQVFEDFPLFNGTVEVTVGGDGALKVRYHRIEPLEFSERRLQAISAAVAADTLLRQPGNFTAKRIIDISLGYFSQNYDAQRWEMAPVWRFAADDGSVYYVNALTGEAEA